MNNNNQTDKKSLGYKMGYLAGIVILGCGVATIAALTIKLITLLF